MYDRVEKNQILRISTIQQELHIPDVKKILKLYEEQEKNTYEILLMQGAEIEELKPDTK